MSVLHFGPEIKVELVIKQKRNNAALGVQLVQIDVYDYRKNYTS